MSVRYNINPHTLSYSISDTLSDLGSQAWIRIGGRLVRDSDPHSQLEQTSNHRDMDSQYATVDQLAEITDRPKAWCVKCVPKCASVRVAPSNIVYYCTDIDPQGKVN